MRAAALVIAVASLIVLAGCLQKIGNGTSLYDQSYESGLSRVPMMTANASQECKIGSCWCMVCRNGTNIFGRAVTSLIGGSCYIEKNCTPDTFANINNPNVTPNAYARQFMIGQGPTFGDFARANTYCADRLSMSVQWLLGNNESNYMEPDAARSMCFLSKDIIPAYILYSNSTNINASESYHIGQILGHGGRNVYNGILTNGPVGPVIVVTEMNFNSSNPTVVQQVAEQVRQIDSGCGNNRPNNIYCYIAVAPKVNDYAGLDAVMRALGADTDKVDFVAYGIDNRYMHTCNGDTIVRQAINFSTYSLYNWSKPTFIPYVLFDPGVNDTDNSCTYTESDVVNGYSTVFNSVLAFKQRGVIGIAPYSFNTTGGAGITNPLNCTDCGVGKYQGRLSAWYGACQQYVTVQTSMGLGGSAENAIRFGNESGSTCNEGFNPAYLYRMTYVGQDIMQPQAPQNPQNFTQLFSCDACLISNVSRPANMIFNISSSAQVRDQVLPSVSVGPRECQSFPEIDQWASARNLDPMLVRAFVLTESNFDPCSAAKVCTKECIQSHCTNNCFPQAFGGDSECYANAYDEMYDPSGNCSASLTNAAPGPRPDWRWCAVGLMQSLEPPYTFWPGQFTPDGSDGQYVDVLTRSGFWTGGGVGPSSLQMARGCDPYFNPFSPADSLCVGTLKLAGFLQQAHSVIDSNRNKLGWAPDYDKDNLFAAYIAGDMYSGFWGERQRSADFQNAWPTCSSGDTNGQCWINSFFDSRTVNDTYCASSNDTIKCKNGHPRYEPPYYCYGATDFIKFVHDCRAPFSSRPVDPGAGKLAAYIALTTTCPNSFCPDGKAFGQALGVGVPASGTYYVPDNVTPATPQNGSGGTGSTSGGGPLGNGTSSTPTGGGGYSYGP